MGLILTSSCRFNNWWCRWYGYGSRPSADLIRYCENMKSQGRSDEQIRNWRRPMTKLGYKNLHTQNNKEETRYGRTWYVAWRHCVHKKANCHKKLLVYLKTAPFAGKNDTIRCHHSSGNSKPSPKSELTNVYYWETKLTISQSREQSTWEHNSYQKRNWIFQTHASD